MNHVFLDRRDGGLRLYLGGDLQFDAADERRYHEPLALVPVLLAARRAAGHALRVLILGGGDGLALRDVLRVPAVGAVHVVDHDPVVLAMARTELATLNAHAFDDPRVTVHVRDAVDFLLEARGFDVVIADFTYPRDVVGARLHSVDVYIRVRAALAPRGVVAVNAVSPEATPEAFGCIAATLNAAGFHARPYTFALPSFAAEGYGRWGFFFASPDGVPDDDVAALAFPPGAGVTVADVVAGADVPRAVALAMRVGPNRTDELLYHVANAAPLAWSAPFERRTAPSVSDDAGADERLTVAAGFARWLRQPEGRRSLETLLACVPLAQRGTARQWILDWSHHAEVSFRQLDLRAFAERALRRAAALPEAWQRELRELAARVRDGVPPMRELLHTTWRVFAVFLLALLLANLLFPDNLYAKGFRSGSSSSGGESMHFATPPARSSPFRYRSYGGRSGYRVQDQFGVPYEAPAFVFSAEGGGRLPVLALTRELRLVDGGGIAYSVPVAGHQFLLHPERLDVLTSRGDRLMSLHPGLLVDQAVSALTAQAPLVDRAMDDHRRWMAWARWGSALESGRQVHSEMAELERVRRAMTAARAQWSTAPRAPQLAPGPDWRPLMPGVFLSEVGGTQVVLVGHDGTAYARPAAPPAALTDVDRFVFGVLQWAATAANDRSLLPTVERWRKAHGTALTPPPSGPRR